MDSCQLTSSSWLEYDQGPFTTPVLAVRRLVHANGAAALSK